MVTLADLDMRIRSEINIFDDMRCLEARLANFSGDVAGRQNWFEGLSKRVKKVIDAELTGQDNLAIYEIFLGPIREKLV
jgi:hypothetical protein